MAKYSLDFKLEVVNYHLSGQAGYKATAHRFALHPSVVQKWVRIFKQHGVHALKPKSKYNNYTAAFKYRVIQAVHQHGLSLRKAAFDFGIMESSVVLSWLRLYESGGISALQEKVRECVSIMKKPSKPNNNKSDQQKTQEELLEELKYLRAENAYLKKLDALIQQEQIQDKKPESSQD